MTENLSDKLKHLSDAATPGEWITQTVNSPQIRHMQAVTMAYEQGQLIAREEAEAMVREAVKVEREACAAITDNMKAHISQNQKTAFEAEQDFDGEKHHAAQCAMYQASIAIRNRREGTQ